MKLRAKRLGLRAVTYSYLTRLKAAATREGLSLSKLQEISQRGKGEGREIGIKRYRGTVRVRESGVRTAERISFKAPLTISQKENPLYPLFQTQCPPSPKPTTPSLSLSTVVFKSLWGTNGERALEKFVWGKAGSLCSWLYQFQRRTGNRLLFEQPLTPALPWQPPRVELIRPTGSLLHPLSAGEPLRSHLPASPTVNPLSFRPFSLRLFSPPPLHTQPHSFPLTLDVKKNRRKNGNGWQISLMLGTFYRRPIMITTPLYQTQRVGCCKSAKNWWNGQHWTNKKREICPFPHNFHIDVCSLAVCN